MTASFNESIVCPILIGRTAELAAFHLFLEQAKSGKGQGALLSGEAGAGKTRGLCLVDGQHHSLPGTGVSPEK